MGDVLRVKAVVSILILAVVLTLAACSPSDPLEDMYTQNIYPGTGTYQIGDNDTRYSEVWTKALFVGDNFTVSNSGIILKGLPTEDPLTEGQLWSDNGTLKVSKGTP